jgi:uncharacterized iron-regulated protein
VAATLQRLPSHQVLLLGEQHDAPEHQALQREIVQLLAGRGQLAALVLEMAPAGGSTSALPATASEPEVRQALTWEERAWPWAAYGPAVMAAVRAQVPVLGGNLPMAQMRERMRDARLEDRLPPEALQRQQALIREGHCGLLPDSQIGPMTRIQIARDLSMAQVIQAQLPQARPGQAVVLITGSVHADKALGVPLHLPPGVAAASLRLQAGGSGIAEERFDQVLRTPPAPEVDHCAGLAEQLRGRGKP